MLVNQYSADRLSLAKRICSALKVLKNQELEWSMLNKDGSIDTYFQVYDVYFGAMASLEKLGR